MFKMKKKTFDTQSFLEFRNTLKSHLQLIRSFLSEKIQMDKMGRSFDNLSTIQSVAPSIEQDENKVEIPISDQEKENNSQKANNQEEISLEKKKEEMNKESQVHSSPFVHHVPSTRTENEINDAIFGLKQLIPMLDSSTMRPGSSIGVDVVKLSQVAASTAREVVTILNSQDVRCHRLVYLIQLLGGATKTAVCMSDVLDEKLLNTCRTFILSFCEFLEILNDSGNNYTAPIVVEEKQKLIKHLSSFLSHLSAALKAERTKCSVCDSIIPAQYVKLQEKPVCMKCYVCHDCSQPLDDCYVVDNRFYCLDHYKEYLISTGLAMSCTSCGHAITDKYMKDNNRFRKIFFSTNFSKN